MSSFQLQNSEVLARLKPFGILFEKSLNDLIKGIRSHSKESAESLLSFLDSAILECKNELNSTDLETKAMAVLKLAYLEMYGFEMTWCNFQILEVMSSNKFQQKRIGYLAAIQSFKNDQDLLILATNQFKKDLNSHNHTEIGLALSGIATIVTSNLSRDINDDVLMKLNHSKPYIRKKAVLAMYKIFLQFPESLKVNFTRIIEKLDDTDTSVVSATINVICEISKKNPNIFVNYLPKFFTILETTSNNWLIIRILKLFQSLSKVEPRMKKKILPTIMSLMLKTNASSLTYECINCIVNGSMLSSDSAKDKETAKVCIEQSMKFFEKRDPNLKFVALLALIKIIKIYPSLLHKVNGLSTLIMQCLTDNDLIIKQKALETCHLLVTEENMPKLVQTLLVQLVPSETVFIPEALKSEITLKILYISSQDNYSNIPNFKWYIAVLKDVIGLTLVPPSSSSSYMMSSHYTDLIATGIGKEFKTLATRVPSSRPLIIDYILDCVQDTRVIAYCPVLLGDFYWIMGEYINDLEDSFPDLKKDEDSGSEDGKSIRPNKLGKYIQLFNSLVNHRIDTILSPSVSSNFPVSALIVRLQVDDVLIVLVQALVKLYSAIVTEYIYSFGINEKLSRSHFSQLSYFLFKLIKFLENWEQHENYEVQERTISWLEFLRLSLEAMTKGDLSEVDKLENEEIAYYRSLKSTEDKNQTSGESESDTYEESDDEDENDKDDESSEEEESSDDDSSKEEQDQDVQSSHSKEAVESGTVKEVEADAKEDNEKLQSSGNPSSDQSLKDEDLRKDVSLSNQEDEIVENKMESIPMILAKVLPTFFNVYQLNPVAKNAQKKIATPGDLNLEDRINDNKFAFFDSNAGENFDDSGLDSYSLFLSDMETSVEDSNSALLKSNDELESEEQKRERLERVKYDPYYLEVPKKKKQTSRAKKLMSSSDSVVSGQGKLEKSSRSPGFDSSESILSIKKKTKPKKLKKEKVTVLSEETVDDGKAEKEEEEEESMAASKQRKKKNILNINMSNWENFDLESSTTPENAAFNDAADKNDYEVDLEELRKKIASKSISKETKKKSKSKSKKIKAMKDEENPSNALKIESLSPSATTSKPKESNEVVNVKKTKKTKKKGKAVIQD